MLTSKNKNYKSIIESSANKILGFANSKLTQTGSLAIGYALKNAKAKLGSYVIVPVTICKSVVDSILHYGCYPFFCDVDDDFCLDLNWLKQQKLPNISALIYVHAYGILKDISNLVNFCKDQNIFLIEDSAQYFCNDQKYQKLAQGDFVIFSFGNGKPISVGEFGLIASNKHNINFYPEIEFTKKLKQLNKKLKKVQKLLKNKTKKVKFYQKFLNNNNLIIKKSIYLDNIFHRLLYKQNNNYQKISDLMYKKMKQNNIDNFQSTIVIEAFREDYLKQIPQIINIQNLSLNNYPCYKYLKQSYYYFRTHDKITKKSIYKICKCFRKVSNDELV